MGIPPKSSMIPAISIHWKSMYYVSSLKVGSPSSWIFLIIYPLVNKHSYGKWPFIVGFPIKHGDFPEGIPIHEGQYNHVLGSMYNPSPAHFCEGPFLWSKNGLLAGLATAANRSLPRSMPWTASRVQCRTFGRACQKASWCNSELGKSAESWEIYLGGGLEP